MKQLATLWHYHQARRGFTAWRERFLLEDWQERQVLRHLRYVANRSPYFRERCGELGLANWRDWPVTAKAEMMTHFDRWNTAGIRLEEAFAFAERAEMTREFSGALRGFTVGLSSGTTGSRGIFLASAREQALWAGMLLARVMRGTLAKKHRAALFLRADSSLYHSVGSRHFQLSFFDLMRPLEEHLTRLVELRPTVLAAPPVVLAQIAESKQVASLLSPPAILLSVADVLDEPERSLIAQGFGVEPGQIYQATEGFLAATCPEGRLHWNEDALVVQKQWLDPDRTRYVPILTDFRRTTQPVIRYQLDDVIRCDDGLPCPCGSLFETFQAIEGRCDDRLRLRSSKGGGEVIIYPDFVRRAMILALPVNTNFTVQQRSWNSWEISTSAKVSFAAIETRVADLCSSLGAECPALVEVAWSPPAGHLKRRRIRCHLAP